MVIKVAKQDTMLAEGLYEGTLKSLKGDPEGDAPKRISLRFNLANDKGEVEKDVSASMEDDAVLRHDTETLLGRQLTRSEVESGFDLASLVGKKATLAVQHRATSGGKLIAAVALILPTTVKATN